MNAKFNPTLVQMDHIFGFKLKMPTFPIGAKVIVKAIKALKATFKIKELNSDQPWCAGKTPGAEFLILPSQLM